MKKGNAGFGSAQRKVFVEKCEGPSPFVYEPKQPLKKESVNFAKGREEIAANSYINKSRYKVINLLYSIQVQVIIVAQQIKAFHTRWDLKHQNKETVPNLYLYRFY